MNLTPLASNMTEIDLGNGNKVLFSYRTPVAYIEGVTAYRTEYKWSATTTRHINKWLGMNPQVFGAQYKPQEFFDRVLNICCESSGTPHTHDGTEVKL